MYKYGVFHIIPSHYGTQYYYWSRIVRRIESKTNARQINCLSIFVAVLKLNRGRECRTCFAFTILTVSQVLFSSSLMKLNNNWLNLKFSVPFFSSYISPVINLNLSLNKCHVLKHFHRSLKTKRWSHRVVNYSNLSVSEQMTSSLLNMIFYIPFSTIDWSYAIISSKQLNIQRSLN